MMRLRITLSLLTVFLACFAACSSAQQGSIASAVPKTAEPVTGAVPKLTEAEKLQESEAVFQKQLMGLDDALGRLEKRLGELRRQAFAPAASDIQRINEDLTLLEQEVNGLATLSVSPLAQLQRSEMLDRLFETKVALEIMNRRWGASPDVFGLDFFRSAPPIQVVGRQGVPENYRIRVGDKLRILTTSELGAQNEYLAVVDSSGGITVPGMGRVSAWGKTAGQLQSLLSGNIKSRFKQLRVEVWVEKLATLQIQVSGDVSRPGTYALSGLATVFNALYQAGGPTRSGTFRRISLVRDGSPKRNIDLYDFLLNGSKEQDVPLEDGDLIFVPPVGPTAWVAGEVIRPGRYEPDFPISLAEVLKMAGGAKPSGYLQSVEVERVVNNEYVVLLSESVAGASGMSKFVIQPGDEISVLAVRPDRTNQVNITGPVAAEGMYGLKENMRVSDLIELARGLAEDREVYMGRGDILRIDPVKGTEILTFNLEKALAGDPEHDLALRKLDQVFVYDPDQVVFRPRLVTLIGAVATPGTYNRREGMRVSDAIAAAGGVLPEAYLARADLIRREEGEKTRLIRVDLQKALDGDPDADYVLRDRDEVNIFTYDEVKWQDHTVRIEGAVQRSGKYLRSEGMRISDLIFTSGGLLPEATDAIELARRDKPGTNKVIQIAVARLRASEADDLILEDGDVVTVPAVNSYVHTPQMVRITGQVANPGPYALNSQSERICDLVARAGGLTEFANVDGALFLRQKEHFENAQQQEDVDAVLERSRIFADKQFLVHLAKMGVRLPEDFMRPAAEPEAELEKPVEVVPEEKLEITGEEPVGNAGAPADEAAVAAAEQEADGASAMGAPLAEAEEPISYRGREKLAAVVTSARISVNLRQALSGVNSPDNLTLRDGDRIFIPKITNVVTVLGAVLHPNSFAAGPGKNADYYVARCGGYARDASRGNVIVVRANGVALPKDAAKSVEPGDMVVVPTTGLIDTAKKWERIGSVTKVIADILSSVFIITRF